MDFLDFVNEHDMVLLDGAMGTQLSERGVEAGVSNLTDPEVVFEVHEKYVGCGCHAMITNTLTMNRIYIETHGLSVDVRDVNLAGVEIAKRAVVEDQYVLGNISSTGQMLEPYGTYKEPDFYKTFREQAEILAEGGVDGFIIETMFDLKEALCALRACKDAASLPVIPSMSFTTAKDGGKTIMGNSARDFAEAAAEAGADVIGTNCGDLDPAEMSEIVGVIREFTTLPIMAEPNAGKPKLIKGKTIFDMDPITFAEGISKCVDAGAKVVGGCCGTTPEHICEVSGRLAKS